MGGEGNGSLKRTLTIVTSNEVKITSQINMKYGFCFLGGAGLLGGGPLIGRGALIERGPNIGRGSAYL